MMAEDQTLRYRDFAILTRSKAAPFAAMLPVLLAEGIPAYADGAAGFFESLEITWTLSMLRLIANGRSDVELIGALRGPAVGLDAEALAKIRIAHPDVPYCDAARRYAEEGDDDIAQRLRGFFLKLEGWRLRAGSLALGEFVRLVLEESGFYTYAGALPGGAQRQANLDQFAIRAGNFDRETSGSLTRFLQFTEHMRAKGDGDAAHLLSESDDVVRLMTIHKSKGLEFRVVFGAQLAKKYRVENTGAPLLAHRDLGIGMSYVDPRLRPRRQTLPQAAIVERGRREDAAEELRILYVLMTRAQQRLVLVGTVKEVPKAWKRWQALSAAPFAAGSHLDVIMAARCGAEAEGLPLHSTLKICPAGSVVPESDGASADAGALAEAVLRDPERYADPGLDAAMAWAYPDPLGARRPMKLTASGLLRELEGPEEVPALAERPQFLSEDARRMTGAERGTAMHLAMQFVELGDADEAAVASRVASLRERHLMTPEQAEAVDCAAIAAFLRSPLGRRAAAAERCYREYRFALLMDASLYDPAGAGEELMLQGVVDCAFDTPDGLVILDFKTDRIAPGGEGERAAVYRPQLEAYAAALSRVLERPVAEKWLWFFTTGQAYLL